MEILTFQTTQERLGGRGGPDQDWQPAGLARLLANHCYQYKLRFEAEGLAVRVSAWYRLRPRLGVVLEQALGRRCGEVCAEPLPGA